MADITITTSRQSPKPDYLKLNIIDQAIIQNNKYTEIDESTTSTDTEDTMSVTSSTGTNNKLKRKKKFSTSLTSVGDAVNHEKRTRIEGIHLNCRGKLNCDFIKSAPTTPTNDRSSPPMIQITKVPKTPTITSPRVAEKIIMLQQQSQQQPPQKVPPPRLKRKLEENVMTIQKLNAQTEQMRLEIAELKAHLGTEKSAVRVLRAQNESESRKWKNEVKKLQNAMELMRKVKKSKDEACANWSGCNNTSNSTTSSVCSSAKDSKDTNHELQRLTNEITSLKDANRILEEKLQMSNDAERRKVADLRELKDSYEIRLTQLTKSAKTEISRLLEEIKTKERSIGQLKKETATLQNQKTNKTTKNNNNHNNKKDITPKITTQHPTEMKKLKDIERNKHNININCNITNKTKTNNDKCFITTTCGDKEFHSMPHEFTERILEAHNDVHAYGSKDHHQNSDSDSALSSAPPSISPQPPANGMEPADIWQTIRNYTKDIEKVQNELNSIQKENQCLQRELNLAKEQIFESEKTAIEATNNLKNQQKLLEKIKQLEQRESELQDETHELREQNELLEFRILELEESNDKWSLQSNTTPNGKNVWNNVNGKESDDGIIFTDRSDSGVTSPHSHHHIDDRINDISPCDLNLLDHTSNENLRRRINQIIKKPNIDEDDKMCLLQVLGLIQNLEAISHGHDSLPSSEESSSLEYIKSRVTDYSSSSRPSSDISPTIHIQKPKSGPSSPQGRIVATVLPYSSSSAVSSPNDSPQRKLRAWHTTSLTESGVFEGDLSETSVCTQTDPEYFCTAEPSETEKLNKIREQFEECAKKYNSPFAKVPLTTTQSLSPNYSEQKRLQYYKERLEFLEGKLLIYESSGDIQAKHLADRLQREIVLENLVKELQDRVDFLEVENSEIEEEKCEFEEAENDTRLRLQRLEVELEILSQRNIELEMSREALQNKLKDCRNESNILREDLAAVQTQVCHLEEDRYRFKENFEFLHNILPAVVLYTMGNCADRGSSGNSGSAVIHSYGQDMDDLNSETGGENILRTEVSSLRGEIRCLKHQINDLNSRHSEAMACADNCWEDLERSYNDRLLASKMKEESLQKKIKQLEDCIRDDSRAAHEKINQLEETERELQANLQKVTREQRKTLQDLGLITDDYRRIKEKYEQLSAEVEGPLKESQERERIANKNLIEELNYLRRVSCDQDTHYRTELNTFQMQLDKLQMELMQIQVTNSELKEEVCTLEQEVCSLQKTKKEDIDKIRCLTDEVRTKEEMCDKLERRLERALKMGPKSKGRDMRGSMDRMSMNCSGISLAQELNANESPSKRSRLDDVPDLKTATSHLGSVLENLKDNDAATPSHRQFQEVANDVKKLAESILAAKNEVSPLAKCSRNHVAFREKTVTRFPSKSCLKDSNQQMYFMEPIFYNTVGPEEMIEKPEGKLISEVPSGLRKLAVPQKLRKPKPYKIPRMACRKKFTRSLQSEIWKVIESLKTIRNENDAVHACDSTKTLKNTSSPSLISYHSVIEEEDTFFEPVNNSELDENWSDPQIEDDSETLMKVTNFITPTITKETQTDTEEEAPPPPKPRSLMMEQLFVSAQKSIKNRKQVDKIRNYLQQRLENDEKFRHGFEVMVHVAFIEGNEDPSYEQVVKAMTFLRKLEEIYHPFEVPLLKTLEERLNLRLLELHCKKVKSEFRCTIFKPITRYGRNYEPKRVIVG